MRNKPKRWKRLICCEAGVQSTGEQAAAEDSIERPGER